jgi:hypothetical protein
VSRNPLWLSDEQCAQNKPYYRRMRSASSEQIVAAITAMSGGLLSGSLRPSDDDL